jgi:diguanylate cyclase (GGDEF)-like protein
VAATDQQIRAAYDALACGVIVQSSSGNVLYANRAAVREELEAALVQPPSGFERIGPDGARIRTSDMPTAVAQRTRTAQRGVVVGIKHDDGRTRWWQIDVVPLVDEIGDVSEIVSSATDITGQREAESALRDQALRDVLTQLPNRALFLDRLEVAVATAVRERTSLALLLMDLDHFKEVNDSFGHAAGDELLRQVASRLSDAIRKSDSLGRLGGDEFAFVLPGTNEAGASVVAQSILETLKRPIDIEDQPVEVGASIGIALFPRHGEHGHALLRRADIAMYTAKRAGTGISTYEFEDLRDASTENPLTTVAELRHGIASGDVTLMYQPIVDLSTGRAEYAEALARWRHPTRGLVPPSEFIAAAEHSGLIRPLFESVLRTALAECARWRKGGVDLRVTVNLSARNLIDPQIDVLVARALEEAQLTAAWLSLEITETMLMFDPERGLRTLMNLRRIGLHLSIDDFGVGYSSLAYLQRLPVYGVKIDRSFIRDMLVDSSSASIVKATIDLAHSLGLKTVAEGVESRETVDALATAGCDAVQGFHIGRPMTASRLTEWTAEHRDSRVVGIDAFSARRARSAHVASAEEDRQADQA